jgi:hypothetical protein
MSAHQRLEQRDGRPKIGFRPAEVRIAEGGGAA